MNKDPRAGARRPLAATISPAPYPPTGQTEIARQRGRYLKAVLLREGGRWRWVLPN